MANRSIKHTTIYRKGSALLNRVPRTFVRLGASEEDYRKAPPIIVNSLPKSGTHLLLQIAQAMPDRRYYGSFIAQTPSLSLKMRSQTEIDRRIARIVPGETLGTHLYYSPETVAAFQKINAVHLFIWRDPRDVLLSEAHYLAEMNRWHAMHKTFAAIKDPDERVRLAITGTGDDGVYPGAEQRIGGYMGWTTDPSCISLRYEEMVHPDTRERECQRVLDAYAAASGGNAVLPSAAALVEAIAPERSHTFNKGGIARWEKEMSAENQALCAERLGPWLTQ